MFDPWLEIVAKPTWRRSRQPLAAKHAPVAKMFVQILNIAGI